MRSSQVKEENQLFCEMKQLNEILQKNMELEMKEEEDHKIRRDDLHRKMMQIIEETQKEEKEFELSKKKLFESSLKVNFRFQYNILRN